MKVRALWTHKLTPDVALSLAHNMSGVLSK